MVKLSLPSWDKDKSQLQAGTSFTPTLTGRVKSSSLPSAPSVFRRLRPPDSATSQTQAADQHPLMVLRLSSPSFLDSVVHDGESDNPLYVIDTVDTVTKIRRSDPKGFVNIARVRWPREPVRSMSRRSKDLTGVEVAFGKGQWRPADDFMGYSYSSLSSYRKFYIPHHKHSLKWKPSGAHYACTTETVRGPIAILEPGIQRAPPQVKILDPLFRVDTSRPQRMHNGLALSLLDFLLVTAMILMTPNDEWMNVTRPNASDSVTESGHPGSSSDPRAPLLHNSEAAPEIERWRSSIIPAQVVEGSQSRRGESSDDSSSRATSRLSFRSDIQSVAQHSSYPSGQVLFSTPSSSSHSLPSQALPSQLVRRGTRELPVPPMPPSFGHNPLSASSIASHLSHLPHGQHSQKEPPPMPPLPTTFPTPPHGPRRPVITPVSVSSRRVTESPTSIHSRSLPTPPTPSSSKPPFPLLPLVPPNSAVSTTAPPLPGPVPPIPHHPTLSRSQSHSYLRRSAAYASSPHDYKPLFKIPHNYAANAHASPPLPISAHTSVLTDVMSTPLSICTTGVTPALSAGAASAVSAETADTSLTAEEDLYDLPPAYSLLDVPRPSRRIRATDDNGDAGGE